MQGFDPRALREEILTVSGDVGLLAVSYLRSLSMGRIKSVESPRRRFVLAETERQTALRDLSG